MIYDIIVIGGGIAGLMAAIEAKTPGNKVAIMTKGNIFKSNSSLASGGINTVLESDDKAVQKHIDDTLAGAKGLADEKAVKHMCQNAGRIIEKLQYFGVEFDKDEHGQTAQRSFGGGSAQRTCYVGDKTGSAITMALIKKARSVGIEFVANTYAMNLAKSGKNISGVIALRRMDSSVMVYPAKAVILAGGGYAGIYRGHTTNAPDFTGDLLALALRAGLELKDMEFVQFHPTGFTKTAYLVSEAARGEGGYLVNSRGERFVDELATRDVVAKAVYDQIQSGSEVFIDLRHLDTNVLETKLPGLYKAAMMQAGIDLGKELLPIEPKAHYSMGGIASDMTQTSQKGVFVCGEAAATGVHGANRLGGNSLLEGAVFGELAGKNARIYSANKAFDCVDYNQVAKDIALVDRAFLGETTKNFNAMRISMGKVLFEKAGIIKDETSLKQAFDYMRYLRRQAITLHTVDKSRANNVELVGILELRNALEVAEAMVLATLRRKESRGSHLRSDYTKENEQYKRSLLLREKNRMFSIDFEQKGILRTIRKFLTN